MTSTDSLSSFPRKPGNATWLFLREWARDPLRVAALAPSSTGLARLITCEIGPGQAPVIELGPGTGVFTRALIDNGIAEDRIAMVELGRRFATELAQAFPRAKVHNMSAEHLRDVEMFGLGRAGAVVSGLGLLSMPNNVVRAIVAGVVHHLRPGAHFYQFTYSVRCPVPRDVLTEFDLQAQRIGTVRRNLPPASVYRITRTG